MLVWFRSCILASKSEMKKGEERGDAKGEEDEKKRRGEERENNLTDCSYNMSASYMDEIFSNINGLLFPGELSSSPPPPLSLLFPSSPFLLLLCDYLTYQ